MNFEKPDSVHKARLRSDRKALRAMGKKGARRAAETRAYNKERRAEAALEEKKDHLYRDLLAEHGEERAEEILKELEGRDT